MNELARFDAWMQYKPADRCPNHELGVWSQTRARWQRENPEAVSGFMWDWLVGEDAIGLDRREYIDVNYFFLPPFETEVLSDDGRYEIIRNSKGIVTRALKEGTIDGMRMSMDEYIEFPIKSPADWPDVKRRLVAGMPQRYPADLDESVRRWEQRTCPLVLGRNCAANGFYWRAREFMGTENLSYAWYDHPALMHEIMEFFADFIIETSRPVLDRIAPDCFTLNEDLSMKGGPLLSPDTFGTFIFPHLKRMVAFFKGKGIKYFAVDTDGDPTVLIPLFMEAGVDLLWPIERASEISPGQWRRQFGKTLLLSGGVDKRELTKGKAAIHAHLREFIPLMEEGGFIPTVDHTVPPDVSWDNFRYYMDAKTALLAGDFGKLE